MASVSGISTVSKVFSKLGDNSGSVIPMFAKDFSSAALTSATYYKEGGSHDGAEKALEEFGTSILWLGGIPFIKKFVFDNFVYKKNNIDPNVSAKRLFSGNDKNMVDTLEFAKEKAKSINFNEQADILQNTIDNRGLAKKLSLTKFGAATAATGLALFGLITLKQKRTENAIKKQVKEKHEKELYTKTALEKSSVYQMFDKKNQEPSFKGLSGIGTFFMTNPVANTAIVDGVITGTRLVQARKGEKAEVGLRELCELLFIYGLAVPLQTGLEKLSESRFKRPIGLDYSVLDSDVIKNAINEEKAKKGSSSLLKQARALVEAAGGKTTNETSKKVIDFIFDDKNKELADVFKKGGDIAVYKTKEGKEQLSLLSNIDTDKLKKTAQKTIDTIENAAKSKDCAKYLKQTKLLKGASIIANIAISAIALGYLQPKLNLYLRQKFHNGDKTNPAIRNLTNQIEQNFAFEGKNAQKENS
ncbi:MAG: hypothetical protein LUE64_06920 [Candidatus Gastranaerophilales bacterium]|nr:hypothetical protein [Candidatus Gastranaerophilales bacterium]